MRSKQVYRPGGKPIIIKTRSGWAVAIGLLAMAAAIMLTGASVISLLAWNWLKGAQVASSELVDADVVGVTPTDIDCRAVIGSAVAADAKIVVSFGGKQIPLISSTLGATSKFRSVTDPTQGGVVDTLVCAKAEGTRDERRVDPTTKRVTHVIHIPVSNIVFDSKVVENESTVIRDDGVVRSLGSDISKLVPFFGDPLSDKLQTGRARLDVAVRAFAINVAQEQCAAEAWSSKLVEHAITDAYREVASARQKDFDASSLTVVFDPAPDGSVTPDFTGPYDLSTIPGDIEFSDLKTDPATTACTVRDGAYRDADTTYTDAEELRSDG